MREVTSWDLAKEAVMCNRTTKVTRKVFARLGMCLLGTAALMLPAATSVDAKPGFHPVIIRGTGTPAPAELNLAYLATFPNGSLKPSVDKLGAGSMFPSDPLIPDSDPTVSFAPGEAVVSIHRPLGLSPDDIPSESIFAPVDFGPGSIVRIRATFIAPVGPYATTGGFAIGLGGRTGGKDDLVSETRVFTTVNVRPNQLVRLNVPFGSVETVNTVLPQDVKDAIFSTTDPQPFTIELTIDRKDGRGTAKLTVIGQVFSLSFTLADFLKDGGPTITAVGPGIAVNSNGPGQTASVHVREFRIYTNARG
ncbi:MAG TPA: hypothetical protein VFO41_10180 [Alphaproteobacteria bacterium]|nr:hypothetical protein [Alphaproteobacteria bacterium]